MCVHSLLIRFLFLQSYFEDNPRDLEVLRHDRSLHVVQEKQHLKNVPDYLSEFTINLKYDYNMCQNSSSSFW